MVSRFSLFERRQGLWSVAFCLTLILAFLYLAWVGTCLMGAIHQAWDDHFITYIYGRNFALGYGLRYNAVDSGPTEGFSSLSHVLLVALANRLHVDSLVATRGLSLLFFLLIPLVVGLPLGRFLDMPMLPVLSISYGAQILYYLSLATIFNLQLGMETVIFMGSLAGLAGWSLAEFDARSASPPLIGWRILFGCLSMALVAISRPEGPILVVITLAMVFISRRYFVPELTNLNDRVYFAISCLAVIGLSIYYVWKKMYFGYLLPNPYYVKTHNAIFGLKTFLLPGWDTTLNFFKFILPWVAAGIFLYVLARHHRTIRRAILTAIIPGVLMVLVYARAVHEAAYFFRYEFPYLVYLHIFLVGLLCILAKRFRFLPVLIVSVFIIWVQFFSYGKSAAAIGATTWLGDTLETINNPFTAVGNDLARTHLGQKATIALSAAGAIPFYSGFRAIDLVGLNDNYLSGRESHTLSEVWQYIDSFKPDVYQANVPPASPGIGSGQHDPVLESPVMKRVLSDPTITLLTKFWDQKKLLQMVRTEMIYLRDHYTFGGAYQLGDEKAWILIYVRRDSPYRDLLLQTLRYSFFVDRTTNLTPFFGNDPRHL